MTSDDRHDSDAPDPGSEGDDAAGPDGSRRGRAVGRGDACRGGGDDPSAWVPLVPPEEAEGELNETYRRLGYRRGVDHIIGVHSLHPRGMEGHVRLYRPLMFGPSPLSRRQRESVAVVVSAANDCFY